MGFSRSTLTLSILAVIGAPAAQPAQPLTVILDFQGSPALAATLAELKNETRQVLARSGVEAQVRLRSETEGEDFPQLVLFRMKGSCRLSDLAPFIDERGPLAWTNTVAGEVLPFGEVACDKVRRAVESALWGGEKRHRDRLFGRALARVIVHEVYHMIGKTHGHEDTGVAKAALSGRDLIADKIGHWSGTGGESVDGRGAARHRIE